MKRCWNSNQNNKPNSSKIFELYHHFFNHIFKKEQKIMKLKNNFKKQKNIDYIVHLIKIANRLVLICKLIIT